MTVKRESAKGYRRSKAMVALRALGTASSGSMAVAQTFLVRLLVLGLNLLTGIVTARFLGPSGRAEQAAMLIGIGLLPFLLSFGLPMAIQYTMRSDPERQDRLVSVATVLSFAFGIVCIAVSFVVLPRLVTKYSPFVLHLSELLMLAAPFAILYTVYCGVLQARSQFAEANFTRYAMPLSTLLALFGLVLAHRMTPLTTSIAYIMPYLWIVPWMWTQVRPKLTFRDFRATASGLLTYGARSYVTDILGTMMAQIDQVLVIGLLSPVSMGIYAVAISAARVSDLFSGPIVTVLFPKASALPLGEIVELTGRAARITFALLVLSLLLSVAALPFLLPAVYGHSFTGSTRVAQILILSIVFNGTVYVLSQAFMASGKPGIMAGIQVLGLSTTIPAMLVLVPRFGLVGAAASLVLSSILRLWMALVCYPTILKQKMPSIILTLDDVRFLSATLKMRLGGEPFLHEASKSRRAG
ncbi:MAG: lipopolysaccharide biosynthesis protein [Vulcanimicrobiaceae bacterium]|jgi:O-antigen/teichoic acid export membrane protein